MHAPGRSSMRPPAGPRRNGQQRGRGTPPYRPNSRASSSTSSDTYTMNSDYYHRRTNSASGNYLHYQSHNMPPRRTESESILPNGSTLLPPPPGYVPPHMRSRMRNDQWKKWQEVKIKIQGLPRSVTTMDIYKMLKGEGEITRIDIDRNPGAIGRAWVTFSPPPHRAVWSEEWRFPNAMRPLIMDLCQQQQYFKTSPVNPNKIYPETMAISVDSVEFGIMYSESAMMVMEKASSKKGLSVNLALDLRRCEISVRFPLAMFDDEKNLLVDAQLRFYVPFQHLREIYEEQHGSIRAIIIPLEGPPRFFRKVQDIEQTHSTDRLWTEWKLWRRQTDITHLPSLLKTAPTALRKKNAIIDIGRWTTYRLEFNTTEADMAAYHQICDALTDWNINIVRHKPTTILKMEPTVLWDIVDAPVSSPRNSASPLYLLNQPVKLDFEVRYQLEACLSNNILNEHNITREFVERLAQMEKNTAKSILEVAMDRKQRFYEPMDIFRLPLGKKAIPKELPAHCVYSRAANITPSTVTFSSPTMEISNRVIRDNMKFSDRFLRVKFTDEKPKGRLGGTEGDTDIQIFNRVWRTLRNGIMIGDRHYEFLAFGNSQFREHGAYFFAPVEDDPIEENNRTPSDIRMCMGEFDEIYEVARYASRMGQCFSTTRAVTTVVADVSGREDIVRNGYTFTDGVGKISLDLAQHIAQEFGHPNAFEDPPSVFQFRLGGCKGVLTISPELKSNQIHVRRSQDKFPAPNYSGLEIIKWSKFATATLNRQLIIVLDSLGIPGTVFMEKLEEQLLDLTKAMTSEDMALSLLQRFVDCNQMTLTLANMILNGFMSVKEPFLMSVLYLWKTWSIKYLKEKAKLFVGDGAFLLGCVDETACLHGHFYSEQNGENLKTKILPEIFVQVSDMDHHSRYKVIEGVCIVARNPSLHPGDIRVVRAVNKPELHHLKNVVVFSQTGDRDVPNMCSGGDLDGDDYLVIWDEELIPQIVNYDSMDFTPPEKVTVDEVKMEHIANFFVEYIKNDSLGKIANAHLAAADYEDEGVMSERCLELARIHSTAVDYPKSGVAAKMDNDLRPKKYPHFMQNEHRPKDRTYVSKKILGQLYDAVEEVDFDPLYDAPFDSRILNAYTVEPAVLDRARALKELYDNAIRRLMAQHNIKTEFEVWSTFILKHNNEIRDYELQEDFGRIWEGLREHFQKLCYEEAAGGFKEDLHSSDDKAARSALQETGRAFKNLGPFVAAMYTVTAQEMQAAVERTRQTMVIAGRTVRQKMSPETMPLMSFPWIFSHQLGIIATGLQDRPEGLTIHPQVQKKQHAPNKTKLISAAQGGWTREDELFVDGGLVKHGDLLDIFHNSDKGKGQQRKEHTATGRDTLRDVSQMPTEPTAPTRSVDTTLSKVMKELEDLQIFPKVTKPDKSATSVATQEQKKPKLQEQAVHATAQANNKCVIDADDPEGSIKNQKTPLFNGTEAKTTGTEPAHHSTTTEGAASPAKKEERDADYLRTVLADPTARSTEELLLRSPPPSIASTPAPEEQRASLPIPPLTYYSREGTPTSFLSQPSIEKDESDDDVPLVAVEELSEVDTRRILGRGRAAARGRGVGSMLPSVAEVEHEEKKLEMEVQGEKGQTGSGAGTNGVVVNGMAKSGVEDGSEGEGEGEGEEVVLLKRKGKTSWDLLKRFA